MAPDMSHRRPLSPASRSEFLPPRSSPSSSEPSPSLPSPSSSSPRWPVRGFGLLKEEKEEDDDDEEEDEDRRAGGCETRSDGGEEDADAFAAANVENRRTDDVLGRVEDGAILGKPPSPAAVPRSGRRLFAAPVGCRSCWGD